MFYSKNKRQTQKKIYQKAQASAEYLVVAGTLLFVLLLPIDNGKNVLELLQEAIIDQYDAYAYASSLPPILE